MKKKLLVFVFTCIAIQTWSQEGFKFDLKVAPNTTYTTEMESTVTGLIDFIAEDAILEQMKASGVETPMNMLQESKMTIVSKTGTTNNEGKIPATMTYETIETKINMNGQTMDQPNQLEDMSIVGQYDTDNKFQLDSISGGGLNEQLRAIITQTLETVQKQIDFPKEELQIGDSFENKIPMTIPMQGMKPMEIVVITNYSLRKVENGLAYFDLTQKLTIDSNQEELKMSATGTGTGTCEFSIHDNWLVKYDSDLPMNLSMEMNQMMNINMQMDTKTSLSVTVD